MNMPSAIAMRGLAFLVALLCCAVVLVFQWHASVGGGDGVSVISQGSEKKAKEEFVSGLTGGTAHEISTLTGVASTSFLLRTVVFHMLGAHGLGELHPRIEFVIEFVLIVVPMLLCMTLWADFGLTVVLCQLTAALFLSWWSSRTHGTLCLLWPSHPKGLKQFQTPRKVFLSSYRVLLLIMTCLAILAVDFVIFPRRFAKTETFGFSLMDAGVGTFVFGNALVSRASRIHAEASAQTPVAARNLDDTPLERSRKSTRRRRTTEPESPQIGLRHRNVSMSSLASSDEQPSGAEAPASSPDRLAVMAQWLVAKSQPVWRAALPGSPLLVLGLVRCIALMTTKAADYQEHVSEYGLQWNFFFTLYGVAVAVELLSVSVAKYRSALVGVAILVAYQVALTGFGLTDAILTHSREGFFWSNREGISSLAGYVALYLIGVQMGHAIHRRKTSDQKLIVFDVLLWAAMILCHLFVEPASRRLCNAAYVLWVVAQSALSLSIGVFMELTMKPYPSVLVNAIARNQLAVFLFANISTGLVNVMTHTLAYESGSAFLLLCGYAFVVCGMAFVWHNEMDLTLKFW